MEKSNYSEILFWRYSLHAIQFSALRVLVFGGNLCKDSYEMSKGERVKLKKLSNLLEKMDFTTTSAPVLDGSNVYGIESDRNHIYLVNDLKWCMIKQ